MTSQDTFVPYTDGEKVPDQDVETIFRPPPEVPKSFLRSTLIIGSRGVGKTVLLRYQKARHEGISIYLALSTELSTITKQIGYGPLAYEITPELREIISGMATALLALGIAERLARKSVSLDKKTLATLLECLPIEFRKHPPRIDLQWISEQKSAIAKAKIDAFSGLSAGRPLATFAATIGESLRQTRGPLLLLLDKADQVTPASLVPVIELLDQSSQFLALAAIRPGYTGQTIEDLAKIVVPGDHYKVLHLGSYPRSTAWKEFVEKAICAQLNLSGYAEKTFYEIDDEIRNWIIFITRDSIRTALELFARVLSVPSADREVELISAAEDARELLLSATQTSLPRFGDFKEVVKGVLTELSQSRNVLGRPVKLSIQPASSEELFDTSTSLNRFVEGGLRCGAFCMPEGEKWIPGAHPLDLELAPILAWQPEDKFVVSPSAPSHTIRRTEGQLGKTSSGGPTKPPSVFIAYRMKAKASIGFRDEIERAIKAHPQLKRLSILDGHVAAGTPNWASKIRELINTSKAVVADVTGIRPDVLFEMGFAFGLKKIVIPVLESKTKFGELPKWLSAAQLGEFSEQAGLRGVVADLATHLADPSYAKLRQPMPIPSLIVWLRDFAWNAKAKEQFSYAIKKEGLTFEQFRDTPFNESMAYRAAQASLLVASLDGTEDDAFVHYICGAIIAKPRAGYKNNSFDRQILLIVSPQLTAANTVAESLGRCHQTAKVVAAEKAADEATAYCKRYSHWASASSERKKGKKK